MANRQLMKWTPTAHEDILIALLQNLNINACDWTAIMRELRVQGYTFSENALRQHLQKLRRNRDNGGPSTPKTPKTPRTPKSKGEMSCKRSAEELVGKDEDDENCECDEVKLKRELFLDDDEKTPSKRPKLKAECEPLFEEMGYGDEA